MRSKKSPTQTCKDNIQALLRECVMVRDGGCILRGKAIAGRCGGYRNDGGLILQAEHLVKRSNSVSYGDLRNIVCLCMNHHLFFKKRNGILYWSLIRSHLGEEKWAWIEKVLNDQKAYPMRLYDWQKVELGLREELKEFKRKNPFYEIAGVERVIT